MKGLRPGSTSERHGPHLLVTADPGSDGYRVNGNVVLREKLYGVPCIACQEDPMSLACKKRLCQG